MFGLIYTAVAALSNSVRHIRNSIINVRNYDKAKEKGNNTYFDYNGGLRLASTNEPVYYSTLNNGDRVLKTLCEGKVVQNFDIEHRENVVREYKENARKNDWESYCLGDFKYVCPDLYKKGRYKFISSKTKVYKMFDETDDNLYFYHSINKLYFRINDCKYIIKDDMKESEKKTIERWQTIQDKDKIDNSITLIGTAIGWEVARR